VTDAEADSPVLSTDISKHADTIEVEADVEVESGVEVEADVLQFEPEPDPTPVKPKDTSSRPLLLIDAELDALLTELESEAAASELEETMKRPAMRMPGEAETDNLVEEAASSEADATPPVKEAPFEDYDMPAVEGDFLEGEFVVEEEVYYALVDTPLPETAESEQEAPAIPDTPLPPISEQLDIPDTPLPATSKQLDIPDTPWPWPELKTPPAIKIELPRPELVQLRTLLRRPLIRHAVALFSLILLITSSLLLWQNLNETHLYLYHIDATSGKTLAQQDLGVFQDISSLTNPALDQSSLLLGVSTTQSKQQQVLSLSGSDTSWNVSREFSAPPGRATLSIAPGHKLAIEDAGGLQVMTSAGRALWQAPGDAPSLGAHAFAPAFDSSTVYTVKSARQGIVAAYDLQSGAPRWTQQLADTLAYAPPLLLAGETLYVAADHTVYALNASTGAILWQAAAPARTLLFEQARHPALIAVGASGLTAFDAQSGAIAWSFNSQPRAANGSSDTLTEAQFYQAGLSSTNNVLYATGIVWDEQQAQQQLWLFAVDASTGSQRWSERIDTGFTSADAGRVFAPFVDSTQGLVLLELAQADGSHTLSAFDSGSGSQRWSMRLAGVSAAAPNMLQVANNTLSIFSAQTGAATTLRSGSRLRLLLLIVAIFALASLLALILLWALPFKVRLSKMSYRLRLLPRYLFAPLKWSARLWRFSRLLFALIIVAAFTCTGILTYLQLNREQSFFNFVGASSGKAMWQHALSSPTTLTGTDDQGGLLVTAVGDHSYQLSALDSKGTLRWTIPSGEATFSFPQFATQPGTMLAALNGPAILNYRYAPDDPAYQNPVAHFLALYLLDSSTGRVLWQSDIVKAGELEDSVIIGADSQFIYIAARALQGNQVAQLIAVDKSSGVIAWRIFGPREQGNAAPDFGALLTTRGRFIYWQVNNEVYALDTLSGQIQWRDAIAEANSSFATLEEGQMATGAGVLLIRRSDMYHALDLANGAERWTLSGLGTGNPHTPGGIVATGSEFILYGGRTIEAFDASTQTILWTHNDLAGVSDATISQDGSLVYAVVFNNLDGNANQQSLVAFDVKTNLVHWTFQPGAQAQLVYQGSRIVFNTRGMLFVTACLLSDLGKCNHQTLYGIDGNTGIVRWKLDASQIYNVGLSQDGNAITFQTNSSAWENLKAIFR